MKQISAESLKEKNRLTYSWAPIEMYEIKNALFPDRKWKTVDEFLEEYRALYRKDKKLLIGNATYLSSPVFPEFNVSLDTFDTRTYDESEMNWQNIGSKKKYIKITDDGLYEIKEVPGNFSAKSLSPGKYILVSKKVLKCVEVR